MACLHDESGGSGSGYDDISEDEDVNRSLVAMTRSRPTLRKRQAGQAAHIHQQPGASARRIGAPVAASADQCRQSRSRCAAGSCTMWRHRYTAYRQFTWWVHHKLGRGNRVPLPSCAVQRIRREFPSTDGSYVAI
ncbi:uncharacterized protein LOC120850652 [Ixodes scapularis]|uniref:uncharacterized protein LOC120850652 n=1 Tax=Ixodes scapularis TaxID=6945 RepID=UPI001A9DE37D|nr:uncharacterized protein LOC120850652 [Ixodes scapularis]